MKLGTNQKIKSSQIWQNKWKKNVLRRCLNIASDGADVTCDGRLFQKLAPETGKARLPTVERLNGGTASWLEEADRSLCQDGTSGYFIGHAFSTVAQNYCMLIMFCRLNFHWPQIDDLWPGMTASSMFWLWEPTATAARSVVYLEITGGDKDIDEARNRNSLSEFKDIHADANWVKCFKTVTSSCHVH